MPRAFFKTPGHRTIGGQDGNRAPHRLPAAPGRNHTATLIAADAAHVHYRDLALALLGAALEEGQDDGLDLAASPSTGPLDPGAQRVIVAPSTALGLADAGAMISTWRPDLPRPVLLLVRDAPLPPPQVVVHRSRALASRCHFTAEIGYLPQVRMLDDPALALKARGRAVRRTRRELRQLRDRLYVAAAWLVHGALPGIPPRLELEAAPPNSAPAPATTPV